MTTPASGFRRRTFVLEFEDPSFNGLIVKARSASLADFTRMQELMLMDLSADENLDERQELYDRLGGTDEFPALIKSWNLLDDNDQPVPINPESLSKEEWPLIRNIVRAWRAAIIEVPAPLSRPSSDGDRLAGLSIPMQTLPAPSMSTSLPNSNTQNGSSDSADDSAASLRPADS